MFIRYNIALRTERTQLLVEGHACFFLNGGRVTNTLGNLVSQFAVRVIFQRQHLS